MSTKVNISTEQTLVKVIESNHNKVNINTEQNLVTVTESGKTKIVRVVEEHLQKIIAHTKDLFVVVGLPRKNFSQTIKPLYNSAAVIYDTHLLGYKDKSLLPTYDVFDERRYFAPGEEEKVFAYKGKKIGILICEDIWKHSGALEVAHYDRDPVQEIARLQPDLVINISASPYYYIKTDSNKVVL